MGNSINQGKCHTSRVVRNIRSSLSQASCWFFKLVFPFIIFFSHYNLYVESFRHSPFAFFFCHAFLWISYCNKMAFASAAGTRNQYEDPCWSLGGPLIRVFAFVSTSHSSKGIYIQRNLWLCIWTAIDAWYKTLVMVLITMRWLVRGLRTRSTVVV